MDAHIESGQPFGQQKTASRETNGCIGRSRNLTGQRFGKLTALSPHGKENGRRGDYWNCRCDCGRLCVCHKESLRSGNIKSCGCLREEQRRKDMEKAIHFVEGTCVEKIASRLMISHGKSGRRGQIGLRYIGGYSRLNFLKGGRADEAYGDGISLWKRKRKIPTGI